MSKKKTKKKEPPSRLEKLVFAITTPFKMDCEIELKQLAVFVGQNGAGKSFVLKTCYALGAIGCGYFAKGKLLLETAQFVLDNTFTDQNFDGTLKAIYSKGSVAVTLEKGKVLSVVPENLVEPVPVIFMSTDLRTFQNMDLYLMFRKGAKEMMELLKGYRLYDVTYMEAMIARCPILLSEQVRNILPAYDFTDKITSIEVDQEECHFQAVMEDGSKKNLASYGNGHQAILNMMIGAG
jgi:hypothetical protein